VTEVRVKRRFQVCLLAALLDVNSCFADDNPAKAEIFYYGWNVLTRARLSLEDVRAHATIKTTIGDAAEAGNLAVWLNLPALITAKPDARDPRLVIDFWSQAGKRSTYYSDGLWLCSEEGSACRAVDDRFRQRFTFGKIP